MTRKGPTDGHGHYGFKVEGAQNSKNNMDIFAARTQGYDVWAQRQILKLERHSFQPDALCEPLSRYKNKHGLWFCFLTAIRVLRSLRSCEIEK